MTRRNLELGATVSLLIMAIILTAVMLFETRGIGEALSSVTILVLLVLMCPYFYKHCRTEYGKHLIRKELQRGKEFQRIAQYTFLVGDEQMVKLSALNTYNYRHDEKITHAAIRGNNGIVIAVAKPGRHHDCLTKRFQLGMEVEFQTRDQGFITSYGRFVERFEAYAIAKQAGQLPVKVLEKEKPGQAVSPRLYTEDLW